MSNALRSRLAEIRRATLKPPPRLNLVEWADERRYLSPEASAKPGRWKTSAVEVARGPMLAVSDPSVHIVTVMCATQLLKALDIETPIPTPRGWTTMGDLQPGDRVFGADGLPCSVTAVTEVRYGHECFRVTFSDGASVIADAGHLWEVDDNECGNVTKSRRVINTQEIFGTFKNGRRNRYAIRMAKPLQIPALNFDIDPYVFGVWLGDGHSYSTTITMHEKDYQVAENIEAAGYSTKIKNRTDTGVLEVWFGLNLPEEICLRGHDRQVMGRTKKGHCAECARQHSQKFQRNHALDPIRPELQTVASMLMRSGQLKGSNKTNSGNEKHIPAHYLRGSFEQRLALLQGLMDTDGTISTTGRCAFTTASERLAQGFRELLSSLGIKGRFRHQKLNYRGEIRTYFMFSFIAYADLPVFRLIRKLSRQPTTEGRRVSETSRRRIVNVERVESVPVKCITVDSAESLYLCGRDMVVTHNTELLLNVIGFHIDQDPAPIILVQPTGDMGDSFSKDRVDPMIRDSPSITDKVAGKRNKAGGNSVDHKSFIGGHLTIVGANAPGDLAMRPVRIILCDEVDKYPESAGEEGDPISLIIERAASFWNYKVVQTCSPTIDGRSRIQLEYESGDQRVFEPPCPFCNHRHELKWTNVKWENGDPETARYVCPECSTPWTDADRMAAVNATRFLPDFGWRATAPFAGHASFRVSKLASPWANDRLPKLVAKFLKAQKSPQLLKVFVNTQLAETYKEVGDAPEWRRLYEGREDYKTNSIPDGAMVIFAGVDVQKDRLEVEVVAYGRNLESWSIDFRVFPGDVTDETGPGSPWPRLKDLLAETWEARRGGLLSIRMMAVDCGYETQTVNRWVRGFPANRVVAVMGRELHATAVGSPTAVDMMISGKKKKRALKQWPIGSNLLKTELYGFLRQERPTGEENGEFPVGFCHFPQYSEEHFKRLTAEQVQKRVVRGYTKYEWIKVRERNEQLDCRNYARAASILWGLDRISDDKWIEIEESLGVIRAPALGEPQKAAEKTEKIGSYSVVRKKSDYWD